MRIKPDMSNYGEAVLSTEAYNGRLGYGYRFYMDRLCTGDVIFWQAEPLKTFLSEIASEAGAEVGLAQTNPDGRVYFSGPIKDPEIPRKAVIHLLEKSAKSVA
jgi:hypothetical protein